MATYSVLRQLRKNVLHQCLSKTALPSTDLPLLERAFHTSSYCLVNRRKDRAVVKHLNYIDHEKSLKHSHSPLVELPDYTYQDGRPTEMTLSFKEKQEKNFNLAKQVVKLVEEVKFAQNQCVAQEEAKVKYEEKRKQSQLKQKGGKR